MAILLTPTQLIKDERCYSMSEQPPTPPPPPPAPAGEPPGVGTIRTMLNATKLLSLIFGILWILAGIGTIVATFGFGIVTAIPLIIFGIIDLIIWKQVSNIQELVDQGKYREAKDKTLIWMILGFILGGVIIGILLLIAYLKYDEVIRATSA